MGSFHESARPMLAILDAHEKALFEEVDECVWQENVTSEQMCSIVDSRLTEDQRGRYYRWARNERLTELARPEKVILKIQQTLYRDFESTRALSRYFRRIKFLGSIPLGHYKGIRFELYLDDYMGELLIELDYRHEESQRRRQRHETDRHDADDCPGLDYEPEDDLAPLTYFYIRQCNRQEASGRQMHQVPASPVHTRQRGRTLFDSSSSSHISGYALLGKRGHFESPSLSPPLPSAFAETTSGEALALRELQQEPWEEPFSDRLLSKRPRLRSFSPSLSAKMTTRTAITHEESRQESGAGACNDDVVKVSTTFDRVIAQPFFYLGQLRLPGHKTGERFPGDYYVAASLFDHSIWLVYNPWNANWEDLEEHSDAEDEIDRLQDPSRQSFRPDWDPAWARLPGLSGRTLMAKVAPDVRTWDFGASSEVEMQLDQAWTGEDVVPSFVCARKDLQQPSRIFDSRDNARAATATFIVGTG